MTINTHAVKTILLAVIAAGSFVAAVVVGMGLGSHSRRRQPAPG
jgi:hypothetical protein